MHSKGILHNDIKCDNIVIVQSTVKVVDFGKATMVSCPLVYNVIAGSESQHTYNEKHRHLAYELRNILNSKQSIQTDTYSVGYLFKHSAATLPYEPIVLIGRLLKCQNVNDRISLNNALDKISNL